MADQKNEKLFADFPPVSDEQWRAVVDKDLKGADFEKKLVKQTPEGVEVRPYYRSSDLPEEEWVRDAKPGQAPYLRGYHADHNDWAIRQAVHETDVKQANMMARRTHERGAQEVSFVMFPGGPDVTTVTDMQQLLDGLDLENTPCFFNSGPLAVAHLALFVAAAERKGSNPNNLKAGVDIDPISDKISGARQGELGDWVNETKQPLEWAINNAPEISVLGIRSRTFQEAGASMVEELAYTLSLFVEYLSGLTDAGLKAGDVVRHTEFRFAVGGNYLLEIAKIRAFRVLLARVLEAYEVDENVRPRLHASTTRSNKTIYDPYVNMLRVSTEAMSAALGGVDSITVLPFDAPFHVPDEFSKRIARNSQILLKEEAYLARIADPLGGSYAIESLTHSLVEHSWQTFTETENSGGFLAAWERGEVREKIGASLQKRMKHVAQRRQVIVGTNNYANQDETRLSDIQRRPEWKQGKPVFAEFASFDELKQKVESGTAIDSLIADPQPDDKALPLVRYAEPFENLRLAVEAHVQKGGKRPVVLLALTGDRTWRKARSNFAYGFFSPAGYLVIEGDPAESTDEMAQAAEQAEADVVVLCSADETYPEVAPELAKKLGDRKLVIAGAPPESPIEGVQDYVHLRVNPLEKLKELHEQFGIKPLGEAK